MEKDFIMLFSILYLVVITLIFVVFGLANQLRQLEDRVNRIEKKKQW